MHTQVHITHTGIEIEVEGSSHCLTCTHLQNTNTGIKIEVEGSSLCLTCTHLHNTHTGIEIKVEGFSHRLPLLAHRLLGSLANGGPSKANWGTVHEGLVRKYRNMAMEVGGVKTIGLARIVYIHRI